MEHRQGVFIVDPYSVQSRALISLIIHSYCICTSKMFEDLHHIEWNFVQGKNHNLEPMLHFLSILFIELAVYCNHLIKNISG